MYYGDSFADLATMRLEGKIKNIYAQAYREIEEKLNTFLAKSVIKEKEYEAKVQAGKLSQEWFDRWKSGQVFIGKRWRDLRQNIAHEIYNSRKSATDMINGERKAVFQDNVNYAQYTIDKDHNFGISFTLYDNATVTRLINEDPDLVPDIKYPDPSIDYAWSKKQITSAITQGILQGESIPELAKRVGKKLQSSNEKSMVRCARTAMTGAQNSGRIQAMHNAQGMGIDVEKLWIATLDGRTRDSHRDLDGQLAKVDEPFHSLLGDIMFPGDPNAAPANLWNCRCSLGWNYPKYSNQYDTRAARDVDWEDGGQTEQIPYMTYKEWEKWKKTGQLPQRGLAVVTKQNDVDEQARIKREKDISHIKSILTSIPEKYHDIIFASVDNADDIMLDIISRTVENVNLSWVDENADGTSNYDNYGNITIVMKDSSGEYRTDIDILRTFWHEYGHYVDDAKRSKSGYGKSYGKYFIDGIGTIVKDEHNWENAAVKDVNELLRKIGLDSKYECRYEDGMYSAYVFNKKVGDYIDPRSSTSYTDTKELTDGLRKWANEFSGKIDLTDYMIKNYDYPVRPDREKYLESYFTPKRNLYREREVFKGARNAYQTAMDKYYEAVDAFAKSHNMDDIQKKWGEVYDRGQQREEALASATDTLDGGVMGSFMAFLTLGGHTPDYYGVNQRGLDEGIANVFSNLVTGDEVEREAFESLCPNLYGLIKGAIKND